MPRSRVVTLRQLDELLRLMEDNADIANGRMVGGALGHQRVLRFWQDVAASLNCVADGTEKSAERWKAYWHDLKYRAKKKAAEVRTHTAGTGGGPSRRPLTATDTRILNIMGPVAYEGHPSVQIPLNVEEYETPPRNRDHDDYAIPPGIPPAASSSRITPAASSSRITPAASSSRITPAASPQVPPAASSPRLPPAAPSPPINQTEEEEEADSEQLGTTRNPRRRVGGSVNRSRSRISADPPLWARRYEERRLEIDAERARAQNRIADVLEAMQPTLARILHLLEGRH